MGSLRSPSALVVAGALFVLHPAVRPWGDVTAESGPAAFASPWWLVAHLAAVAGFVLVGVGLHGLQDRVAGTPGARSGRAALGSWVAGATMVLPYYGAETFALNALGARPAAAGEVVALAEAVRMGPVQIAAFGVGLLLLAVAAVFAAAALVRAGLPGRRGGTVFAVGFLLFLPQFFLAPPVRIAHGVLVGVGCVLLARALWRGAGTGSGVRDLAAPGETTRSG